MTELLRQAHQMLYSYQLTRWQGTKDFAPERSLTRQEAARFMTEFATNVLCRKPSRSYANQFTDLGDTDPTLCFLISINHMTTSFSMEMGILTEIKHKRPLDLMI